MALPVVPPFDCECDISFPVNRKLAFFKDLERWFFYAYFPLRFLFDIGKRVECYELIIEVVAVVILLKAVSHVI